jgi:predicted nucleic acid-binding protein
LNTKSGVQESLRRIKPEKRFAQLIPRDRSRLEFIETIDESPQKLLLDTTTYIDALQSRIPNISDDIFRTAELWHSTVTEAELATILGRLDPRHADTPQTRGRVVALLERRPSHRIINPDGRVWREAGILAGTLARLQHYAKSEHRRALNDALIFLSAAYNGLAVLTRNVADFDFLMQLAPFGKAVFYDRV